MIKFVLLALMLGCATDKSTAISHSKISIKLECMGGHTIEGVRPNESLMRYSLKRQTYYMSFRSSEAQANLGNSFCEQAIGSHAGLIGWSPRQNIVCLPGEIVEVMPVCGWIE
jgi:hypothetical protein